MPDEIQGLDTVGQEFAALQGRAAQDEAEPIGSLGAGAGDVPAPALDWSLASAGLVGLFAVYADNWALTVDEQGKLASHLSAALSLWFPDVMMNEKWQALAGLGMVMGGVAMSRMDPETRRLQPLRKPKPEEPERAAS